MLLLLSLLLLVKVPLNSLCSWEAGADVHF